MAYELAKVVSAFFDTKDLKHELTGENESVIMTGFGGKENVGSVGLVLFFDEERTVHFTTKDFVHVPQNRMDAIYPLLNELNKRYRWAKFTVDDEGDIFAETNGVLDLDTCGDECIEIILRLVDIVDDAYPSIMKGIYGA